MQNLESAGNSVFGVCHGPSFFLLKFTTKTQSLKGSNEIPESCFISHLLIIFSPMFPKVCPLKSFCLMLLPSFPFSLAFKLISLFLDSLVLLRLSG